MGRELGDQRRKAIASDQRSKQCPVTLLAGTVGLQSKVLVGSRHVPIPKAGASARPPCRNTSVRGGDEQLTLKPSGL